MSDKLTDELNYGSNNPFDFDSRYFVVVFLISNLMKDTFKKT